MNPARSAADIERAATREVLGTVGRLLAATLGLWLLSGVIGLVGLALRDVVSSWPRYLQYVLLSLGSVAALPGILAAAVLGSGANWLIGGTEHAAERAPLVTGGLVAVLGLWVAKQTADGVRELETAKERARVKDSQRRATANPSLIADFVDLEMLSVRSAVVNKARSDAFLSVLNRWLVGAVVAVVAVAGAIEMVREYF